MKKLRHIWGYLTSPSYRHWVDFCTQKEMIGKQMSLIQDQLRLQIHPMFYYDGDSIKKVK